MNDRIGSGKVFEQIGTCDVGLGPGDLRLIQLRPAPRQRENAGYPRFVGEGPKKARPNVSAGTGYDYSHADTLVGDYWSSSHILGPKH